MTEEVHDPEALRALLAQAKSASYTPGRAALPQLIAALELDDDKASKIATRALLRAGDAGAEAIVDALEDARPPRRGRLARVLARFAQQGHAPSRERVVALLNDEDEHTRRVAINAVGQWPDLEPDDEQQLETRLLALWRADEPLPTRRALARSLGRVGARPSRNVLAKVKTDDPELARIVAEARLVLRRRLTRDDDAPGDALDLEAVLDAPAWVEVRCRRGLERMLADELADCAVRATRPGRVVLDFCGPLPALFVARTMLDFGFTLAPRDLARHGNDPADALTDALCSPDALRVLRTFSPGGARYRIEWASAGKQRGATWRCVREVAKRCPELVNDPGERGWEVVARERDGKLWVTLVPRLDDPRFTYRLGDVPAASHPTLAAALARLGGVRDDDIVWDPFVGSGSELVERARLGPCARLVGSDLDAGALDTARANLEAADLAHVELIEADALSEVVPGGADLILTNPPMGRRLSNEADVGNLLERFVAHAARQLRPGGRLVWISPQPERTDAVAQQAGLRCAESFTVDMGGFAGTMQRLEK